MLARASGESRRRVSARSIMSCAVLPVMMVVGEVQQRVQRRPGSGRQRVAEQARREYHGTEQRDGRQLRQHAAVAEYQRRAERDEITVDVRGEQSLQRQESGRIDEAAVDAEQYR